jgi:L-asparagine transporter-like permease
MNKSFFIRNPITYFWIISNFLILFLDYKKAFSNASIDGKVVLIGNFILFMATLLSYVFFRQSIKSDSPNAAVRGMYKSFMIKFFVCLLAAVIYIMAAKKDVNKAGLIICMGLYIIYTVFEVTALQKLLKQKKNA